MNDQHRSFPNEPFRPHMYPKWEDLPKPLKRITDRVDRHERLDREGFAKLLGSVRQPEPLRALELLKLALAQLKRLRP